MELRPCKVRIGFLPIKVSFLDWGVVLPPSTLLLYCKITPLSYVSKIILYAILIVFGLQIPSYYVQDILWTKLAPAGPFPGVYILHWGQLDKMQQLLSIIFEDFKILPIRIETALRCFIYCAHDLGCIFFKWLNFFPQPFSPMCFAQILTLSVALKWVNMHIKL